MPISKTTFCRFLLVCNTTAQRAAKISGMNYVGIIQLRVGLSKKKQFTVGIVGIFYISINIWRCAFLTHQMMRDITCVIESIHQNAAPSIGAWLRSHYATLVTNTPNGHSSF